MKSNINEAADKNKEEKKIILGAITTETLRRQVKIFFLFFFSCDPFSIEPLRDLGR